MLSQRESNNNNILTINIGNYVAMYGFYITRNFKNARLVFEFTTI